MAGAFPDAAIGYRRLVRSDSFVLIERRKLVRRFEAAVLLAGHSPGNAPRARDVAAALTSLRQPGWRKDFAGELVWTAHVDESVALGLKGALDLGQKRPERHISLHRPIGCFGDCWHLSCELTTLASPFLPATVHQAHVLVAVDLHLPQRPGGEPVVVVAVEDHRCIVADAGLGHQPFEGVLRDDVAFHRVAELRRPVPGYGACDVTLIVSRGVDVHLDEANAGILAVFCDPRGLDEHFRMRVLSHMTSPTLCTSDGVASLTPWRSLSRTTHHSTPPCPCRYSSDR